MVEKAKTLIPDFIKDGYKKAAEPLSKAEKALEGALSKNFEKLDTAELKKLFDDVLVKVRTARGEVEHALSAGMIKTMHALNVPTRGELENVKSDVALLSKEVKAMKVPAKKGAAPASKKAAAPAPKKAAKRGR